MTLRFLCSTLRVELSRNQELAIHLWQNEVAVGQALCEKRLWKEALPHLGRAFEASDFLLTTRVVEPSCAHELFTSSAILLFNAFGKLGSLYKSREIYWAAVKCLTHQISCHPDEQTSIDGHLEHLYKNFRQLRSVGHRPSFGAACIHHYQRTVVC